MRLNTTKGYKQVRLRKDGKTYTYSVHRLVAFTFISNPVNKPCINHIDSNRSNNHVDNLEWVTHAENTAHAIKVGRHKYASKHYKTKEMKLAELVEAGVHINTAKYALGI